MLGGYILRNMIQILLSSSQAAAVETVGAGRMASKVRMAFKYQTAAFYRPVKVTAAQEVETVATAEPAGMADTASVYKNFTA